MRIFDQFLCALAILAASPAVSATATLEFEGTLDDVKLSGFATPHNVSVGDTFAMSVTMDTGTPIEGSFQNGKIGIYHQAVTDVTLTLAGLSYTFVDQPYSANTPNRTGIANDVPSGDDLAFSAPVAGPDLGGESVGYVTAAFLRADKSTLDSIGLDEIIKLGNLPVSTWAEANFYLHFGNNPASGVARLDGEFTSVSIAAVPLPATAILLASAVLGCGAIARRKPTNWNKTLTPKKDFS